MGRDPSLRMAWENERRIVDDVLPLPAGPGLLIRSVQQGQVRWALKVLHADGSVGVYDVPVKRRISLRISRETSVRAGWSCCFGQPPAQESRWDTHAASSDRFPAGLVSGFEGPSMAAH
jgi:hypothetical protein